MSLGNIKSYLLCCQLFTIRRNSVSPGLSFSLFFDIEDWTEAKHDCKPFSVAAESPDAKDTCRCLEMVKDGVPRDYAAELSKSVQKQRTKS